MVVLVTDGEERAALAACRGLARAGHIVAVAAARRPAAAQSSRACARRLLVPRSLSGDEFVSALAKAARTDAYDFVLPGSDAALLALSMFRERLPSSLLLGLPPHQTVARSLDKPALLEEADRTGFPVLESEECAGMSQALAAAKLFGFPVVVKPTTSIVSPGHRPRREAARVVHDRAQFDRALSALGTPVLVQRFYDGAPVLSLGGVATEHGLAALTAARWSRRWPPVDGAASFAETVVPPSRIVERAETLIAAFGWRGIFELELLDLGNGGFAPVDLNPRVFGWMTLALRAGANLPAVWLECLRGPQPPRVIARPGVRYRWEEGDVRHFFWQVRHRHPHAAAAVLRPRRRVAHAYFERSDPAPLAAAAIDLARRSVHRTLTRRG
jgi:predicted ATP-grasp superfamily ATP-dependent carboligase